MEVLVAPDVQHLDAGCEQLAGGVQGGVVEAARALGSAADQQHRQFGMQAEAVALGSLPAQASGGGQFCDLRADRQPLKTRAGQRGAGEGGEHRGSEPCGDLVGDAGNGILFLDDHRDAQATGGQVGRHRDVAPEPAHHIRLGLPQDAFRGPHRAGQPERHLQQVEAGLSGQRHCGHEFEDEAGLRDDASLQAAGRADAGDLHLRFGGLERLRGCDQRRRVACCATTGKHDTHHGPSPIIDGHSASSLSPINGKAPDRHRRALSSGRGAHRSH